MTGVVVLLSMMAEVISYSPLSGVGQEDGQICRLVQEPDTNNICEREMRIVATLRNNSLFWGSHTSAERLSVILTIVRSSLMNSLNVYQYMVYVLKTIPSYKGDLADLLANKWKPSDAALLPILA